MKFSLISEADFPSLPFVGLLSSCQLPVRWDVCKKQKVNLKKKMLKAS